MGILKSGWTLAEHTPMLLLVTPTSGPLPLRKVTCRGANPFTRLTSGQRASAGLGRGRKELVKAGLAEERCCPVLSECLGFHGTPTPTPQTIPTGVFTLNLSQQAELCKEHSPTSLPGTPSLRSQSAGVGAHLSEAPQGRSRGCFPTSLCDLIGILAQALARVMRPGVPGTRPPPQEFASGSAVLRQSEPRRGSGSLYLLCARSLQLPPVAATAARSPGTAPPAAGSAPRHPCPARHAPASTTHPGRPGRLKIMQPRCGHGSAPTPGLGTPPTLAGRPLGGDCPRRTWASRGPGAGGFAN